MRGASRPLNLPSSPPLRHVYQVTFHEFPRFPQQNNVFTHEGNPHLNSFTCDVSKANGTNPSCIITDLIKTNVKEYKLCSGRGSCDTGSGLCDRYNSFVGVNCGKLTSQRNSLGSVLGCINGRILNTS